MSKGADLSKEYSMGNAVKAWSKYPGPLGQDIYKITIHVKEDKYD